MQETLVQSLGWEDPLEEEMAIHSSILAWGFGQRSLVAYSQRGCKASDTISDQTITVIVSKLEMLSGSLAALLVFCLLGLWLWEAFWPVGFPRFPSLSPSVSLPFPIAVCPCSPLSHLLQVWTSLGWEILCLEVTGSRAGTMSNHYRTTGL